MNNTNCIICLEDLDEEIMDVCDICKVQCHILCLYNWYKKNNCEICPICLKVDNNINIVNNRLNEIENEESVRELENEESVRELETIIEINNNEIIEINQNEKYIYIISGCVCMLIILLIMNII